LKGIDRDRLFVALIGEAVADIQRRIGNTDYETFLTDRDEQALTAFRLSIIGENANKLSHELKSRHPGIPWLDMVAFRNYVAHEYHRVDLAMVWEAVLSLGQIEAMVDAEQAKLNEQGQ
jgi:uncharacterized protein with HEPN domain